MKALHENLEELINTSAILILQFGDDACGPCHAIRFKLEKWLEGKNIRARYVDIKENLEVCSQMGIFSAPTVIVYMDGQVAARESGYFSLDEMLGRVERYMEMRTG